MTNIDVLEQVEFTYPKDNNYIYCLPEALEISSNQTYCILGLSGSGKSTILTLLAALRRFRKGTIRYRFDTKSVIKVTRKNWHKKVTPQFWGNMGYSFQKPELIRALTVKKNLDLALDEENTEEMALALFKKTEWDQIKNSNIWELSGGQTQRLGIIRAFGHRQNVVFMDEPTNNLDKNNRKKLADFIQKYKKDKSIIIVSHDKAFTDMLNISEIFEIDEEKQADGRSQRILRFRDEL